MPASKVRSVLILALLVGLLAAQGFAWEHEPRKAGEKLPDLEARPFQIMEDFESHPLWDCALQYYYYIPCPTYSWFWAYSGWKPGDILGMTFAIGDVPTGAFDLCDPSVCGKVEYLRVLDLAGYGTVYFGLFTVEMDMYCCDTTGTPYCHVWNSGARETHAGWNYLRVDPPVNLWSLCPDWCHNPWECPLPRVAVTMTMTGTEGIYPAVGFDNIGSAVQTGCLMHDFGCLPALYPRTWAGGKGNKVHSGYVGTYPFQYWPPLPLPDGATYDSELRHQCGFVEAAWRIYFICGGPTLLEQGTRPTTTWGAIKSMYE